MNHEKNPEQPSEYEAQGGIAGGFVAAQRMSAVAALRSRANSLETKAARLRALADRCEMLEPGSAAEVALWDLATSSH